ncbi:MAG: hypothetical protein QM536_03485 [Chitinophagaceae bacterium]|nr:hypothetical protein [Chitinophagaceae bacterium]
MLSINPQYTTYLYESFLHRRNTKIQIIHIILLVLVIGALVALPLIKVPISIQGGTIIRPLYRKNRGKIPYY